MTGGLVGAGEPNVAQSLYFLESRHHKHSVRRLKTQSRQRLPTELVHETKVPKSAVGLALLEMTTCRPYLTVSVNGCLLLAS